VLEYKYRGKQRKLIKMEAKATEYITLEAIFETEEAAKNGCPWDLPS
jgi:hypothetical protein